MNIERTFQQKVDLAAILGQFLTNTRTEDLIVELVQNEIDAGSSRTVITFGAQALVCEGNGDLIDEAGWERLDMVLGAGGSVAAKVDGIGAKNHGLRTGFKFGDDIVVQSDGWRMELTLCRDNHKRRLDPGNWSRVRDPSGPTRGTKITIPYRTRPLDVPSGEGFVLAVLTTERLRSLFEDAATEAPGRFLSAVSTTHSQYQLELRWGTSERRLLEFDRAPARVPDWPGLVRRTCREIADDGSSTVLIKEAVAIFPIKLSAGDHGKVPRLFRSGRQRQGELSWNLDERGRPVAGIGKLRYPIGYPDGDFDAYSGHGFHISAPFVSDTTRHGLAADSERNRLLLDQARTAMVDLLRTKLLPKYGPTALALLRRPDRPDPERERAIAIALLDSGALLVRRRTEAGRLGEPRLHKVGASLTVVSFADTPSRVARELIPLAPVAAQLLDERTPAFVVDALSHTGSSFVSVWSDRDAVLQLVAATEAEKDRRLKQPMDVVRMATTIRTLEIAQRALDRESLPEALIAKLLDHGLLPVATGHEQPWRSVYFSREPVPTIDGVQTPPTLHPKLTRLRQFTAGPLKLTRFRLDEYLCRLNFAPTGKAPRDRFFGWLTKRHEALKPSTLAKLAEFPIWPTRDGGHAVLSAFVWPRSEKLRDMLAGVVPQPSVALERFPALRRSVRGALYVRTSPTQPELQRWFSQAAERIDDAEAAEDAPKMRRELAELEDCLGYLLEEPHLCGLVPVIAVDHRSLSMAGTRVPVKALHLSTPSVEASCLLQRDLIAGPHHRLYDRLGAQQHPSTEALLRALQEDVVGGELLFRRLEALGSTSLGLLEGLRIIPIGGKVLRPIDLALPLQADLWGHWRLIWSSPDISPDRSASLVRMGVARVLTETLSAEFFRWLSTQQVAVQAAHLPQIHRHLRDRQRGPLKWWSGDPDLACLPTRGHDGLFELVSYRQATNKRGPVFLPDFPELQEQVLEFDRAKRLVITDVAGLSGTLFTPLRDAHVRSLRRSFGRPVALTASGEIRSADPSVEAMLTKLRTEAMIGELPQRLELHGLSQDGLRGSWRSHIRALRSVRTAPDLRAQFTFSGRTYTAPYSSGVDAATGLVWLSQGRDHFMLLYEALASFLFDEGMDPLTPYGLMRAVEMPFASAGRASDILGVNEELSEATPEDQTPHRPGERGHGLTQTDLRPAVPNPTAFSKEPIPRPSSGVLSRGHKRPRPAASTAGLRGTVQELEQTRQLKEDHYGFHCQACLGLHDVQVLTPPQTYLELPKYRRGIVEAHHVDHLQNEGALGASNLIALCKYHHELLGDRLTREMIRTGLASATPLLRRFPTAREGTFKDLNGLEVRIPLDVSPFEVKLFFTVEHADVWCK